MGIKDKTELTEAIVMDIVKNRYKKTDEKSITSFHFQRETKAKIEDVIPHYLNGDMEKAAMDFAAYLQTNKMQLKWDS